MPNALVVVLCAVAAASFWTVLGFALARRLVGPALALPIAPALGWAVHSAAALPILLLAGFSTTTVAIVSAAALAGSLVALLLQRPRHEDPPDLLRSRLGLSRRGRAGARCRGGDHAQGRHRRSRVRPADLRPLQGRVDRRDDAAGIAAGQPVLRRGRRAGVAAGLLLPLAFQRRRARAPHRSERLGSRYRDDVVHGVLVARADARIGELVRRPRDGAVGSAAQRRAVVSCGARRPVRNRRRAPGAHASNRVWRLAVSSGMGAAAYRGGIGRHPRAVLPGPAGDRTQPIAARDADAAGGRRIRKFDLDRRRAVSGRGGDGRRDAPDRSCAAPAHELSGLVRRRRDPGDLPGLAAAP